MKRNNQKNKQKNRQVKQTNKPPLAGKKYIRNKLIVIGLIVIFGLILYFDSRTGFIKSLFGDKVIEFRIRK